MKRWLTSLLAAAALALPAMANAAAYTFPSAMPAGCSGSNGSYSCGNLTLGYNDTVTISGTKPATVTITGNFTTDNAQINQAGTASDLTLTISGTLTLGYQARIKANITAGAISDSGGGQVIIVGNLTANSGGNITLADSANVTGNLTTSGGGTITTGRAATITGNVTSGSGAITISETSTVTGNVTGSGGAITVVQQAVVQGNVTSSSGAVTLGFQSRVNGNLTTTSGAITAGQESRVGGTLTSTTGSVTIGYAATVVGALSTSTGAISFDQNAVAQACVRSTGSASITLGYQSNINSVCCGSGSCSSSCVTNNSTYAMPALCSGGTTLLADYRMDETTAWNGTAAEVKDASGNAYHGQAATAQASTPVATNTSGSPAQGTTTTGSCGYGVFNRASPSTTHAYVQLPGTFPTLTTSFTVLAWIRTSSTSTPLQRILSRDDNQNGWGLSFGDSGGNRLRLFNRNVQYSGAVTTSGSNGAGATTGNCNTGAYLCLDSAAILSANTWYYVAALVDTTAKTVQTLIYDTSGTLLAGATTAYTGTWSTGTGGTTIGGESISSAEGTGTAHFNGNIDELQVYSGLLSTTAITTQLSRSRTCPGVASYAFSGTGSASTCTPQTITITARDALGNTLTGYTGTINLSTSTTDGDWSLPTSGTMPSGTLTPGAGNSGLASYTFVAADNGVVRLRLAHSLAQNVTVTAVDSVVAGSSTTSAAVQYRDNAFVLSEDVGNLVSGSYVAVAGRAHDFRVQLYKKDPTTGNCSIATDYTGSRNLKLWRTDNGGPWTAPSVVAATVPTAKPGASNLTVAFTAGVGSFNLSTTDVGKYALTLEDDSLTYAATSVLGSSSDLTVRPFTLAVTGLTLTNAPNTNNPNGSAATDTVFGKAGAPFSAAVTAYRWHTGADSNNDGVPDAGATLTQVSAGGIATGFSGSVSLSMAANSVTPGGGTPGALANNTISSFTSGVGSTNSMTYSEVGSFALNTTGVVSSYLSTAGLNLDALVFNASGAQNTRVGRFVPAGFDVGNFVVTHRSSMSCSPASTFSYMGEGMNFAFTLTAKNVAGGTTANYTGSFAKFDPTNASNFNLAGISGSTMWKTSNSRMTTAFPSGSWNNGVLNFSMTANAQRNSSSADGPHPNAQFGIVPTDSDGVTMLTLNLDTDSPANGNDRTLLGQVPLRYGRLRLQNAMAAANRTLKMPLTAQYWDSSTSTFKTNELDSCTRITSANLSFGNFRRTLTTADAVMSPNSVTVSPTTATYITLAAPGGGRVGSVDVALALGSNTTDASCLSWTPSITATAGANINAMRGAWCGAASALRDPSARATWGLYRGSDGVLYQRENY